MKPAARALNEEQIRTVGLVCPGGLATPRRDHPDPNRLMPKILDLTGQRFARWTVLHRTPNQGRSTMWMCRCDCGTEKTVFVTALRSGLSTSCGCRRAEVSKRRLTTHGMANSVEHSIWRGIKSRCYDTNKRNWCHYGGRGIAVCDRWLESFENFYADMGPRPSRRHSVERINNDLGYTPENCIWATIDQQANNRRNNVVIEYEGRSATIVQWARKKGVKPPTLYRRISEGMPIAEALVPPFARDRG